MMLLEVVSLLEPWSLKSSSASQLPLEVVYFRQHKVPRAIVVPNQTNRKPLLRLFQVQPEPSPRTKVLPRDYFPFELYPPASSTALA